MVTIILTNVWGLRQGQACAEICSVKRGHFSVSQETGKLVDLAGARLLAGTIAFVESVIRRRGG